MAANFLENLLQNLSRFRRVQSSNETWNTDESVMLFASDFDIRMVARVIMLHVIEISLRVVRASVKEEQEREEL